MASRRGHAESQGAAPPNSVVATRFSRAPHLAARVSSVSREVGERGHAAAEREVGGGVGRPHNETRSTMPPSLRIWSELSGPNILFGLSCQPKHGSASQNGFS